MKKKNKKKKKKFDYVEILLKVGIIIVLIMGVMAVIGIIFVIIYLSQSIIKLIIKQLSSFLPLIKIYGQELRNGAGAISLFS